MVAPAVPEITEEVLQESIEARTESLISLRELGPPDLVHLIKQPTRQAGKHYGVYHHVTGIDASSSASLAAYINTLAYKEFGPSATTKTLEGTYCCYNAFSRVDMRVHAPFPGSVESYCIDERGEKRKATDELWLETYLCSVLRAYSYADDGTGSAIRRIVGVRRFNPVTNTETEHRFLSAAEQLFFSGWQLGSDSVVQVPNAVSNHLTAGLLKYFQTTGRFTSGINLFQKLRSQNVQVASLLAKVLFMGNEEVQGVRVLYDAVKELPMDYVMLDTQAEFLLKKAESAATPEQKEERLRMALGCANRSTIAAPSEFGTWARLAQVYVALEDWENALTTLNSCPMFTYQDKDTPVMPEPKEFHLPVLPETRLDEFEDNETVQPVDQSLLALRAAQYRGTFKQAYGILTEMTKKIGWDQLLKIRSNVFVMEDEYREKQETTQQTYPAKRNASTDALRGTPDPATNGGASEPEDAPEAEDGEKDNGLSVNGEDIERPSSAMDPEEVKKGEDNSSSEDHASRLNNKRLCERWLDSLFMVLYEDLRVYTIWRTQMAQYRAQSMVYKKSPEEWEILGSLAERLQHNDEAVEAYRHCLSTRFSPKALSGILKSFVREKLTKDAVAATIRLVAWHYRWYSEFSPELLHTVRMLIEDEGAVKIRSIVQATNLPQSILDLTHHYAALCATFRSSGTEA
ncbi:Bud site selection protein 7 [Podospora fimiseda]|uniref:Bud site selection protein 7 n=1 Tax=Podospora fimiseda TaxID=252190 RepID=A0AAN7BSD4_9PEZI|nr:Bud site selection protein 7 [Podospora fimiseda]